MHDLNALVKGSTRFTVLDLVKGYFHVPVRTEDIPKTAIITPFGLWEFLRMPFGLKNAGQTFQRLMHGILRDLPFIFVYLDDVLVFSPNEDEHLDHVRQVLTRLHEHGLTVNRDKCVINQEAVKFLGVKVSAEGVGTLEQRVEAIREMEPPTTKVGVQRVLGLVNFYRRFVPHMDEIVLPLTELTKTKDKNIPWPPEAAQAFEKVKTAIADATMLVHPDPTAPTALTSDASDGAIGAELAQRQDDGSWKPLAFFSRRLSAAEKKYATLDKELLALFAAIKHFAWFLDGRPFIAYTDHKPLTTILTSRTVHPPRRTRHMAEISEFTTDIRYVRGEQNVVADALSRPPEEPEPQDHPGTVSQPASLPCSACGQRVLAARLPDVDYEALARDQLQSEEVQAYRTAITDLQLQDVPFADGNFTVLCDMSQGRPRPVVPEEWKKNIFDVVHNLSHAGKKATTTALSKRFIWHGLKKDVTRWCKTCIPCQRAKVARHVRAPLVERPPPDRRFGSVHVDLVGPLPMSQGHNYLFTVIDRFTKWTEAIPLQDIRASTCANAFLSGWISRFGVPNDVTSDRGAQFTSNLWSELHVLLGAVAHRTTAYHPQANGHVERFHRSLKASLMAVLNTPDWMSALPMVMLGLRSAIKADSGISPAELVYGQNLRLPGELLEQPDREALPCDDFVGRLRRQMARIRPIPTVLHTGGRTSYVPDDLRQAQHVFIRRDAVKPPLTAPYEGPFPVLDKQEKYFTVQVGNNQKKITVDRLKPAFLPTDLRPLGDGEHEDDDDEPFLPVLPAQAPEIPVPQVPEPVQAPDIPVLEDENDQFYDAEQEPDIDFRDQIPEPFQEPVAPEPAPAPAAEPQRTRSGRTVRPPSHLQDYDLNATTLATAHGAYAGGGYCSAQGLNAFEFPALGSLNPLARSFQTSWDKKVKRSNQAARQSTEKHLFCSY